MIEIIIYLWGLTLLIAFWMLICNEVTYRQRNKVISDFTEVEGVISKFQSISYNEHLFRIATFRWNWRSWYYASK